MRKDHETRTAWEAASGVLAAVALQGLLAGVSADQAWKLWHLPWWTWLIPIAPELALVLTLSLHRPRRKLKEIGVRRSVAIVLVAVVALANALALVALIGSVVSGQEHRGGELLFKGAVVWLTNVMTFGLWFWEIDRGGPAARHGPNPGPLDFQFPQSENPELAERGWLPGLVDYVYIAFTNALAFSPTDAMPLTRRAKMLMLAGSLVSAITVLLVAARAVNIFH